MIVVRLLVFERMEAAVADMRSKPVFGSMRYKARHAGYAYIMMYAILACQQKQVNVFSGSFSEDWYSTQRKIHLHSETDADVRFEVFVLFALGTLARSCSANLHISCMNN